MTHRPRRRESNESGSGYAAAEAARLRLQPCSMRSVEILENDVFCKRQNKENFTSSG